MGIIQSICFCLTSQTPGGAGGETGQTQSPLATCHYVMSANNGTCQSSPDMRHSQGDGDGT